MEEGAFIGDNTTTAAKAFTPALIAILFCFHEMSLDRKLARGWVTQIYLFVDKRGRNEDRKIRLLYLKKWRKDACGSIIDRSLITRHDG